jgi:DNA-binding XRE family transcriptional regulator
MPLLMRQFRQRHALTQQDAADLAQVSLATWGGWERGVRPIPYRSWQRLAAVMSELERPGSSPASVAARGVR